MPSSTVPARDPRTWQDVQRITGLADINRLCLACGRVLRRVLFLERRQWRSCPTCSSQNGSYHVFYAYPGSFSAPHQRELGDHARRGHANCPTCRGDDCGDTESRLCEML